jgi:hypothetical protein
VTAVSEELTAFITALMIDAISSTETSVNIY